MSEPMKDVLWCDRHQASAPFPGSDACWFSIAKEAIKERPTLCHLVDFSSLGYVHVSQMIDMFDKAVYPTEFGEDLDGWFVPREAVYGGFR